MSFNALKGVLLRRLNDTLAKFKCSVVQSSVLNRELVFSDVSAQWRCRVRRFESPVNETA
jgi:hypothetical protein